jgi:hypothetical protein
LQKKGKETKRKKKINRKRKRKKKAEMGRALYPTSGVHTDLVGV